MAERQASTKTEQQGLTLLREEAAKKTSSLIISLYWLTAAHIYIAGSVQ